NLTYTQALHKLQAAGTIPDLSTAEAIAVFLAHSDPSDGSTRDDLCPQCTVEEHDTCALVSGCACCADTLAQLGENPELAADKHGTTVSLTVWADENGEFLLSDGDFGNPGCDD